MSQPESQSLGGNVLRRPFQHTASFFIKASQIFSMEASGTVASWLSFTATVVGLGSLISQASVINDKLDPFHATRIVEYLGVWFKRQRSIPWWRITKAPPVGPLIKARLSEGFCEHNTIHCTRLPKGQYGKAAWTVLLSVFHPNPAPALHQTNVEAAEKGFLFTTATLEKVGATSTHDEWASLEDRPLVRHGSPKHVYLSVGRR